MHHGRYADEFERILMKNDRNRGKYFLCTDKTRKWIEGLLQKAMDRVQREDLSRYEIAGVSKQNGWVKS